MLAALHCIAALGETPAGTTFSSLLTPFNRYVASGEINTRVDNQASVIEAITAKYGENDLDELDGLTVAADTWWFNVRASNTEPLLRLNVEAREPDKMEELRDDILSIMNQTSSAPFGIAPELWAVLSCPCDAHGALIPESTGLVCTVCSAHFPVRDGIPVMLLN